MKKVCNLSDAFFYILCSGLTEKTREKFTCYNSSFTECVRKHLPVHSFLTSNLPECTDQNYALQTPCQYTRPGVTLQSGQNTFRYIESRGCSANKGGVIYLTGSSTSLTMSDCLFYRCSSTTGDGGAIYGNNCGLVSLQRSSLLECTCTTNGNGGGISVYGTSILPEITANTFISCSGRADAGGLIIYHTTGVTNAANLPVKYCRFISCVAYGTILNNNNDADCGGLEYWENEHTLGIHNSIFTKCESKQRGGGCGVTINSYYFDQIIRFCFFSENTAPSGRNAIIPFNGSSSNLWSIVFYHSYTCDGDLDNSLLQNYPNIVPVNGAWLSYGVLSFLIEA